MSTETTTQKADLEQFETAEQTRGGHYFRPAVDIIEQASELLLLADMPGLATDLIDVRFEDGNLTIHGRVPSRQPSDVRYLVREYEIGDFYRTFRVSEDIDAEGIHAEYGNGTLTLHLPKSAAAQPRRISVTAK